MKQTKRGRRLAYGHIIRALDPEQRYGLNGLMRFAKENGFIVPAEDDPRDKGGNCILRPEQLRERYRRTFACYRDRLDVHKGAMVYDGATEEEGWYGCYWQLVILPLTKAERIDRRRHLKRLALAELEQERAEEAAITQHMVVMQRLDEEIAAVERDLVKCARIRKKIERRAQSVLWSRFQRLRTGVRIGVALTLAGLVATAGGMVLVLNPLDVLRSHGPAAARRFLGEGEPRTLEARYQHSWLAFLDGEHERAAQGAYTLLGEDGITAHMRGNGYYLLGSIRSKNGHYDLALGLFSAAYDAYGDAQAPANQYFVAVEMANAHAALAHLARADEWLSRAWRHYLADRAGGRKIADLGQYYLVRVDLAAARGDHQAALAAARARLVLASV